MIANASQAGEVVSFAKFPPLGLRGQGGPFACYEFGLKTPAEYVAQANGLILVAVQIETREGLQNVADIAKVEGVGRADVNIGLLHGATDISSRHAANRTQ